MFKLILLASVLALGVEWVIENLPDWFELENTFLLFLAPGVLLSFFVKEPTSRAYLKRAFLVSLWLTLIFGTVDAFLTSDPYLLTALLAVYAGVLGFAGLCLGRLITDNARSLMRLKRKRESPPQ